jgi:hypothetical protein
MAYTINYYNGTILANIADGTLNTSTSLSLAGRNFVGYGEYLNENQLFLLENFAGTSGPTNPIRGQLWYNTSTQAISVYTGSTYTALANAEVLASAISTTNTNIRANVDTINTNILANVAVINANAGVQDTQITNLLANAATQNSSIVTLTANAGAQSQRLDSIDANVTAANAAIALRATTYSPTLTGNPRAPTATVADNSTSVATTAYVMAQDSIRREYTDTNILANVGALEASTTTAIGLRANIADPTFTGTPAAPTAAAGTRTTQLATTAYVMAQDDTQRIYIDTAIAGNVTTVTTATNNNLAFKAPLASPALTGVPTAPTATAGTNTTQIATTAFVRAAITGNTALWQGSQRYIDSAAPDNAIGNNGDFWFQYQ